MTQKLGDGKETVDQTKTKEKSKHNNLVFPTAWANLRHPVWLEDQHHFSPITGHERIQHVNNYDAHIRQYDRDTLRIWQRYIFYT